MTEVREVFTDIISVVYCGNELGLSSVAKSSAGNEAVTRPISGSINDASLSVCIDTRASTTLLCEQALRANTRTSYDQTDHGNPREGGCTTLSAS